MEVEWDGAFVGGEVVGAFGEFRADEVHAPLRVAAKGECVEQRTQSFADADLASKEDAELRGRLVVFAPAKYAGAGVGSVGDDDDLARGDAEMDELVANDGAGDGVVIGEEILLILALEIRGVVGANVGEVFADALVFGLHDADPFADGAGRVIEHGADAQLSRCAEGVEGLAGHGMDKIARL